jgi:hypothetical protein
MISIINKIYLQEYLHIKLHIIFYFSKKDNNALRNGKVECKVKIEYEY